MKSDEESSTPVVLSREQIEKMRDYLLDLECPFTEDEANALCDAALRTHSESGLSVAPMMLPPEQFDAAKERALCDWPTGRFRLFDDPDPHKPCYLVCPDGATVGFSHHDGNGVDKARVQFIVDACNVALSKHSAIGTTYRQVGWAQIELRATQGGMLYEVAGSVSDERTEHHTEPVYIAVVEAADRKAVKP